MYHFPEFPEIVSDAPLDVGAAINPNEDPAWKRARLTLKQYLEVCRRSLIWL